MAKCDHAPPGETARRISSPSDWSALNGIQPLLLKELSAIQPDNAKVSWIRNYLADRPFSSLPEQRIGCATAERRRVATYSHFGSRDEGSRCFFVSSDHFITVRLANRNLNTLASAHDRLVTNPLSP